MPPNAQIFSDLAHYEHYANFYDKYCKKYASDLKERLKKEKLARAEVKTPEPALKHCHCHVCHKYFGEGGYKQHIRSEAHA